MPKCKIGSKERKPNHINHKDSLQKGMTSHSGSADPGVSATVDRRSQILELLLLLPYGVILIS